MTSGEPIPSADSPSRPRDAGDGLVSVVSVSRALLFGLRHWFLVIVVPWLATFALVMSVLPGNRSWTAGAAFVPEASAGPRNDLSGFAAQLGVSISGSGDAQSPQFYVELLRSREIMLPVVDGEYQVPKGDETFQGTLA